MEKINITKCGLVYGTDIW